MSFQPVLQLSGAARAVHFRAYDNAPLAVAVQTNPLFDPTPSGSKQTDSVEELAYKISYVGALILTADRVWRSVDSVLDSMKFDGQNGHLLRFTCEPASRGFEVMVRVSRPIDF